MSGFMVHILAILGLIVAVILWYLIQRHAHGPEGSTACGKPRSGSSNCENKWDEEPHGPKG